MIKLSRPYQSSSSNMASYFVHQPKTWEKLNIIGSFPMFDAWCARSSAKIPLGQSSAAGDTLFVHTKTKSYINTAGDGSGSILESKHIEL